MICRSERTIACWPTVVLGLALVPAVVGCWNRGLHCVEGRVSYADGSPLPAGRVVIEYGDGKMASGRIEPDGSFRVGTLKDGDGMRAGTYRVSIKDALVPKSETSSEFATVVHKRFSDPATSGIEFTVPDQLVWQIVVEKP
jgi:hypothetical protein